MKKLTILALAVFLMTAFALTAQAEKISLPHADFKKDMSGVFSADSDPELSEDKKSELKKSNDKFLDEVLGIAGGSDSDEDKKQKLFNLSKKQSGAVSQILG